MKYTSIFLSIFAVTFLAVSCNKQPIIPPTSEQNAPSSTTQMIKDKDSGTETPEIAAAEKTAAQTSKTQNEAAEEAVGHGNYLTYSAETLKAELASGRKVVLFFYADWCPFCVEADKQFKAKLNQLPEGVTILKTDYDTETTIKKKYFVTYQHTFVQIDAQGNMVSKWISGDVDNLKKNLK